MRVFMNNDFRRQVRVFSKVRVAFSEGGEEFGAPVEVAHARDDQAQYGRFVPVALRNGVGKFVQVQMYFAADWLLVSEVEFDSGRNEKMFPDILSSEANPTMNSAFFSFQLKRRLQFCPKRLLCQHYHLSHLEAQHNHLDLLKERQKTRLILKRQQQPQHQRHLQPPHNHLSHLLRLRRKRQKTTTMKTSITRKRLHSMTSSLI